MKHSLVIFLTLTTLSLCCPTFAQIPQLMQFQGKATDAQEAPLNGSYKLTFRIYDVATGGTPIWNETHNSVSIENGVFSVALGSVTPLNIAFDKPYWISTEIGTITGANEMPRIAITSTGYAYRAETAQTAQIAQAAPIPFYISGLELIYDSATNVKVNPGFLCHGETNINKTSIITLTLATAADWWDGAVHSYASRAGWCYIGVNTLGGIKLLGENPPNRADTLGNTAGILRYWYDGSAYWRVIGAVRCAAANPPTISAPFYQNGDIIMYDVPVNLTSTAQANFTALSCSPAIPAISRLGIFNINTYAWGSGQGMGARSAVWIRPTGSTGGACTDTDWGLGALISNPYATKDYTCGISSIFCMTNASQSIDYKSVGGAQTYIDVMGYVLNIR